MQPTQFTCYQARIIYCVAKGWECVCVCVCVSATADSNGLIVQSPMTNEKIWSIGGIWTEKKNKVLREKPLPTPFCAPYTTHGQPWEQTRALTPLLLLALYGTILRSYMRLHGEIKRHTLARTNFNKILTFSTDFHKVQYVKFQGNPFSGSNADTWGRTRRS